LPIPGNDDSMRSIELVIKMLADAILAARIKRWSKASTPPKAPTRGNRGRRISPSGLHRRRPAAAASRIHRISIAN